MATSVTLPELGESVTEGTVTRWLKSVGDEVAVDEPIVEISTDKVDTEIPSPVAGTLLEIKADEDETIEVGGELAVIGDSGESSGGGEAPADEGKAEETQAEESKPDEPAPEPEPEPEPESEPAAEKEPEPEQQPASDQEPHLDTKQTSSGTAVVLPELGESVTEGTVTRWLKAVGDEVAVDEPLLEISTDKVDTEIPSPVAGTLVEIKAEEDETVEVGAQLAIIGEAGAEPAKAEEAAAEKKEPEPEKKEPEPEPEKKEPEPEPEKKEPEPEPEKKEPEPEPEKKEEPEPAKAESPPPPEPAPEPAQTPPNGSGSATQGGGDTYVTPIVRKLAKQHGVDLATVTGTGVGGRIRKQDVLDAASKPAPDSGATPAAKPAAKAEPSPLRGKTEPLSRLRKTIATRMIQSLQSSAQLTQVHEVDVTEIARLRAKHKDAFLEREGVKLTYLPFFAKAAVESLKQYPQLNSAIDMDEGTVTYPSGEHLGVAVDTERGLIVPTIRDAGDLSIAGLARKIADAAERTRTNKITPDELSGATFTITNLGSNGALFDTPIINQPQVAILGVGAVVKRPVVLEDAQGESIAVRHMAYLALTYDHRIVDGADAGRFLTAVKQRLEQGSYEGELG